MTASDSAKLLQSLGFIVGSALGAGILAFPVVTSIAGYLPSLIWSVVVAVALGKTALLLAERTIEMGGNAHIPTLCRRAIGARFEKFVLLMILMHYGALLVAYSSVGAALAKSFLGLSDRSLWRQEALYFALIAILSLLRPKIFFLVNSLMTLALALSYFGLLGSGWDLVKPINLTAHHFSLSCFTLPIFFSAFGFHSVIPSMCRFCQFDQKLIRKAVWSGIFVIWLVVILWQTLVMGAVDLASLQQLLHRGEPATSALARFGHRPAITYFAQLFALFAVITSHTGVIFALRDFCTDFLRHFRISKSGTRLMTLFFVALPMLGAHNFPDIFETALTFSGGIGSTFLNGLVPVFLNIEWNSRWTSRQNWRLVPPAALALLVMGMELTNLFTHRF